MVRGERDYTQRVLASVRPMGIWGGRTLFVENFESLVTHVDTVSAQFTKTVTQGQVWQGDASGKMPILADQSAGYYVSFPIVVEGIHAAEFFFKPSGENLQEIDLNFSIYSGIGRIRPEAHLDTSSGVLELQIRDSEGQDKVVHTFKGSIIRNLWHYLLLKFNLATGNYVAVQYDQVREAITTESMQAIADETTPGSQFSLIFTGKPGETETVYFDDISVTYEEA